MNKIYLQGKSYPLTINRKRMKNIYVRAVHGEVVVSAPYRTPIHEIEQLIRNHEGKIVKALEAYSPHMEFIDGGYVYLFGRKIPLKIRDLHENRCAMHNGILYAYSGRIETLRMYLKDILYKYVEDKIKEYLRHDFNLPMPRISIKSYKGRWGSCYYKDNKVSFNEKLVHLDLDLIDYVIVHELCHFYEANHSKRFYAEIEKRMPDYRERIKHLKEHHI